MLLIVSLGEGSPFYSTDYLNAIPDSVFNAISCVELKFVPQDVEPGNRAAECAEDGSAHDFICLESELSEIWWYKFTAISDLHRDRLHLDFTKTFSPDGTFLGNALVQLV